MIEIIQNTLDVIEAKVDGKVYFFTFDVTDTLATCHIDGVAVDETSEHVGQVLEEVLAAL